MRMPMWLHQDIVDVADGDNAFIFPTGFDQAVIV